MVDNDRRPVALEVFDGQPKILEVHAAAVQVDRGVAGSSPEQPEQPMPTSLESRTVTSCAARSRPISFAPAL